MTRAGGVPLDRRRVVGRRGSTTGAWRHTNGEVVLAARGEVDQDATRARRAELAATRRRLPVLADERDPYEGERGKHRLLRLEPGLARELGVSACELLGRHPAPLRAWVKLDPEVGDAVIGLDSLGRRILGIESGDTVELRRLPMPPIPGGLVG